MERGGLIVGRNEVVGVAVHAIGDGTIAFTHVHLHRRADGVHVRGQGGTTDIAELVKACGTRIPLALTLDTDRCVHRLLPRTGEPDDLLRQAFPNATLDDLCISVWPAGPATGLSMARRTLVNDVLARFRAHGFRTVQVSIGPWALLHLRGLLRDDTAPWTMAGHVFSFTDGDLAGHAPIRAPEDGTFALDEDRIERRCALAFTAAWEHLVPSRERPDTVLEDVATDRREERARYHYERGLVLAVLLFVALIGGERLVAHRLARSQALLQGSASAHTRDLEALEALRADVRGMEGIGAALGTGSNEGLSRQAARVAATVPAGIRLERLVERPLRSPLKEREPLETERGVVRITGTCRDAATLDAWMSAVKGTGGFGTVRPISYAIDAETGTPRFELELAP